MYVLYMSEDTVMYVVTITCIHVFAFTLYVCFSFVSLSPLFPHICFVIICRSLGYTQVSMLIVPRGVAA